MSEFWMGRQEQYPLDDDQVSNSSELIPLINELLIEFYKAHPNVPRRSVTSGYRPSAINAKVKGASKKSAHMSCQAIDLWDRDRLLGVWCKKNVHLLERLGLYLEDPAYTPTWTHLQTRPTRNRIFKP